MEDQSSKLIKVGVKTVLQLSDISPEISLAGRSGITHVFSSPEALAAGRRGRRLLLEEKNFVQNIMAIAVDEAHCIGKW